MENYIQGKIKYLIVIEGTASQDSYAYNYELSYQRALSLYRLWQSANIRLEGPIFEVVIAGSGTHGIDRFSTAEERKNQRIIIQILPKIGIEED